MRGQYITLDGQRQHNQQTMMYSPKNKITSLPLTWWQHKIDTTLFYYRPRLNDLSIRYQEATNINIIYAKEVEIIIVIFPYIYQAVRLENLLSTTSSDVWDVLAMTKFWHAEKWVRSGKVGLDLRTGVVGVVRDMGQNSQIHYSTWFLVQGALNDQTSLLWTGKQRSHLREEARNHPKYFAQVSDQWRKAPFLLQDVTKLQIDLHVYEHSALWCHVAVAKSWCWSPLPKVRKKWEKNVRKREGMKEGDLFTGILHLWLRGRRWIRVRMVRHENEKVMANRCSNMGVPLQSKQWSQDKPYSTFPTPTLSFSQ